MLTMCVVHVEAFFFFSTRVTLRLQSLCIAEKCRVLNQFQIQLLSFLKRIEPMSAAPGSSPANLVLARHARRFDVHAMLSCFCFCQIFLNNPTTKRNEIMPNNSVISLWGVNCCGTVRSILCHCHSPIITGKPTNMNLFGRVFVVQCQ
jgi:hypothetical protein